ncbi:unnamed protein product [Bathycoccus prasinos]
MATLLSSGIVRMTTTTTTFVLKNAGLFKAKGFGGGSSSLFHPHRQQQMDKRRTLKAVTNSNSFSSSSNTNKAKKKATTSDNVEKRQRMTHMAKVRASFSPSSSSSSTEEKMFTVQHNLESLSDKIFCNRSLPMKSIRSVGFDMDYTLAMYKPETFERLVYTKTIAKLVSHYGYPKEILKSFQFDETYMVRGLVIDKKRGNVLKMDRHNYVKVVVHGFKAVSTEERLMTYCDSSKVGTSFTGNEYQAMDTLFALAEAYLFCQLVEMKDLVMIDEKKKKNKEYEKLTNVSYHQMFDEIRKSVDLCHRDGSLKTEVAKDPAKYIVPDESLKELLTTLKTSGRSVFLLTNSLFDYTNVVMNFLISGKTGEEKNLDWLEYFDSVFVGSMKPNFFTQDNNIIFEVDAKTYMLKNTDSGGPLTPIGGSDIDHVSAPSSSKPGDDENTYDSKVYQGGSYVHLMDSLGISRGSDVLYVGDHIFGDILRSKKTLGWRTMLIVPEMDHELEVLEETREEGVLDELKQLRERRDELDYKLQKIIFEEKRQKEKEKMAKTSEEMKMVEQLEKDFETAKLEHRKKTKEYHERFHWVWGALMKSGYQNSRFAHQVERYACVYTSKVSNMLRYSPEASFRAFSDTMPHDNSSP